MLFKETLETRRLLHRSSLYFDRNDFTTILHQEVDLVLRIRCIVMRLGRELSHELLENEVLRHRTFEWKISIKKQCLIFYFAHRIEQARVEEEKLEMILHFIRFQRIARL